MRGRKKNLCENYTQNVIDIRCAKRESKVKKEHIHKQKQTDKDAPIVKQQP